MAKQWLAKWAAKPGGTFSHLLLDGGKLSVADQQHSTFLNDYSNAIARGQTLYVVESKTPVFRLFVDFDFKPPPSMDIVHAAIKSAAGVASYYFDADSVATVLRKDVESPDKIGVHMTWDSVYVDLKNANAFRNHLVSKMMDACAEVDWKDIIDASVYAGSGLRMPWSSKKNAPGVYVPVYTCSGAGDLEQVPAVDTASCIREWIRKTCIRAPSATPTPTCVVTSEPAELTPAAPTGTEKSMPTSIADHVLEQIQALLPACYAAQKFTGMHRYGDFCIILRSSSKTCGNKEYKEHHTNTVYFVVLKKGYMYQRCYCRKDVVREGGVTCTEYVGPSWPLPKELVDALWPPVPEATNALLKMLDRTRPVLKKKQRTL